MLETAPKLVLKSLAGIFGQILLIKLHVDSLYLPLHHVTHNLLLMCIQVLRLLNLTDLCQELRWYKLVTSLQWLQANLSD